MTLGQVQNSSVVDGGNIVEFHGFVVEFHGSDVVEFHGSDVVEFHGSVVKFHGSVVGTFGTGWAASRIIILIKTVNEIV